LYVLVYISFSIYIFFNL